VRKRSGESDEGQASTTGEKIKAPATGVNNAGADVKALRAAQLTATNGPCRRRLSSWI
jgi:hypothetical protein